MDCIYEYQGRISPMRPDDVLAAYRNAEARCRTAGLAYVDLPLFPEQVEQIKAMWPAEAKSFIKQKAKGISAGNPITTLVIKQALIATIKEFLAPARAAGGGAVERETALILAELSLCSIFRTVVGLGPVRYGGKTVRIKPTASPRKLVVNIGEEQAFDAYVYAASVPDGAYLVGWASTEDLLAAPSGNKETDPKNCPWRTPAHYIFAERLRPMAEFARLSGFKEFQAGTFFETPPQRGWIPMEATRQQKDAWKLANIHDDLDFNKMFDLKPVREEKHS